MRLPAHHNVAQWLALAFGVLAIAVDAQHAAAPAGSGPTTVYPNKPIVFAAGNWGTISNVFFLAVGFWTDLLHIRVMLVIGYGALFMEVALGYPNTSTWGVNPHFPVVQLDNLLFFGLALLAQIYALVMLLWEEVPARLKGDDDLLWRLFYRRCGAIKREFSYMLKLGEWRSYKAGEIMERRNKDQPRAFLIFKGVLRLEDSSGKLAPIRLASGQLANLWLFNLFGVTLGFDQDPDERELMIAESDIVAFTWDVPALLKMSSNEISWALAGYWRSFLLSCVSCHYAAYSVGETPRTSNGTPEPDPQAWLEGRAQTADITDPLRPEELPGKITFKSVMHFLFDNVCIKAPLGTRHYATPKTGAIATARVLLAAKMRERHQTLPPALSSDLEEELARADQDVVAQIAHELLQDSTPDGHQHHKWSLDRHKHNKHGVNGQAHDDSDDVAAAGRNRDTTDRAAAGGDVEQATGPASASAAGAGTKAMR